MLSIKNNVVNEIIVKKSKFITYLFRIDNEDDIKSYLDELRLIHSDATHVCYAYIIDSVKRFSDDGEPSGTAGMPILNVLESNNLDHILCCVVRYFGGVKLGANGLVRAYSKSSSLAIDECSIVNLVLGKLCSINFKYDDTKTIDNLLKDSIIIDKKYENMVSYIFKISNGNFINKCDELNKFGTLNELEYCYIEENLKWFFFLIFR